MRTVLLVIALMVAVCAGLGYQVLGRVVPTLTQLDTSELPRGVFHVHSESSHDSDVSLDTIAAAAKNLDLDFVVVTDHNEQLAGPVQMDGVLIISYAELSSSFGHVIQLGAQPMLSKSQRQAPDVLRTIVNRGGSPVIAHPTDRKRPWEGRFGVGGLEIFSVSSAFRHNAGPLFLGVIPMAITYGLAPDLAVAQLYVRDAQAMRLWDTEHDPRVFGICGVDAHGRIDVERNLGLWSVRVHRPLPAGDATAQAEAVLSALRQGQFDCASLHFGGRPTFSFLGEDAPGEFIYPGASVREQDIQTLFVRGPKRESSVLLFRNGDLIVRSTEGQIIYPRPKPGLYRAEVMLEVPHAFFGSYSATIAFSNRIAVTPTSPQTEWVRDFYPHYP